ncbi:hypothetical protein [Jannaschia pohangensis]|uniref:hypothetical protein n=1 Tax=Jannaschia pohangensis TaxID=390807 RepID=UPI001113AD3A|nr:hypothetical protein [Jannaschia pohangensis]
MRSIFDRFLRKQERQSNDHDEVHGMRFPRPEDGDVRTSGFPLVPDDYHLKHVGKTAKGNGYWIDVQLAREKGGTRDFVAAYVFDREGDLIHSEVVDRGLRKEEPDQPLEEIIGKLKKKIDAKNVTEIIVKPFSVSFYGHTFGLVVREAEDGEGTSEETLIDAMPGYTLMFYGPWSLCNYDT